MDVHVPRPITRRLRKLGVDVVTSQEDGTARWSDSDLLTRATELNKVLFSQDEDLLVEAARRQSLGIVFNGVIYAPQLALTIGQLIEQLELLAKAGDPADFANRVQYLALCLHKSDDKVPPQGVRDAFDGGEAHVCRVILEA